jgi:hypothetical protein
MRENSQMDRGHAFLGYDQFRSRSRRELVLSRRYAIDRYQNTAQSLVCTKMHIINSAKFMNIIVFTFAFCEDI